jgi:hypothetical protein
LKTLCHEEGESLVAREHCGKQKLRRERRHARHGAVPAMYDYIPAMYDYIPAM